MSDDGPLDRRWIGRWLIGMGVIHTIAGLVFHGSALGEIAAAGIWNTLDAQGRDGGRSLAFWFLIAGFILALLGALVDWIERHHGGRVPSLLGWSLLALAALGIVLVPTLAFWLLLPPAIAAIARARRASGPSSSGPRRA